MNAVSACARQSRRWADCADLPWRMRALVFAPMQSDAHWRIVDEPPCGIPCRARYRAARDTMPLGKPCRAGSHAVRDGWQIDGGLDVFRQNDHDRCEALLHNQETESPVTSYTLTACVSCARMLSCRVVSCRNVSCRGCCAFIAYQHSVASVQHTPYHERHMLLRTCPVWHAPPSI